MPNNDLLIPVPQHAGAPALLQREVQCPHTRVARAAALAVPDFNERSSFAHSALHLDEHLLKNPFRDLWHGHYSGIHIL